MVEQERQQLPKFYLNYKGAMQFAPVFSHVGAPQPPSWGLQSQSDDPSRR
jgi:hypothetical protein